MAIEVKILWVDIEFNGPLSGMAEYQGEHVWFLRNDNEEYDLYRLTPENIEVINKDYEMRAKELGLPLRYGDLKPPKPRNTVTKANIKIYNRVCNPYALPKEFIRTIKVTDFINYFVPHQIG